MSWTANAEVIADTTEIGGHGAIMCGRSRATGLDVRAWRGLIGATLSLGRRPHGGLGSHAWSDDREFVDGLFDLIDEVGARYDHVRRFIGAAQRQWAGLLDVLARLEKDEDDTMIRGELADIAAALEVLSPVPRRLAYADARLRATPAEMGETYAAVYRLVESGRRLPLDGRWLTGETI